MLSRFRGLCAVLALLSAITVSKADGPELSVTPEALFFRQLTSAQPSPLTIALTAKSGTLGSFSAVASSTGNWLSVNPTSGSGSAKLTVSLNTSALSAAEYSGTITISAQGFPNKVVKVQLAVTPATVAPPGRPITPIAP